MEHRSEVRRELFCYLIQVFRMCVSFTCGYTGREACDYESNPTQSVCGCVRTFCLSAGLNIVGRSRWMWLPLCSHDVRDERRDTECEKGGESNGITTEEKRETGGRGALRRRDDQ